MSNLLHSNFTLTSKVILLSSFSFFTSVLSSNYAKAEDDITFIGSLAYQNKNLSFDQKYSGTDTNTAEFSVDLPMINGSLTAAYKKFFITLKLEKNLADTSTATSETNRALIQQANLIALDDSEVNVKREDLTFTVGYNPWRTFNIFVGYLNGETELEPDAFCADPFASSPCSRTNRAFLQFFLDDNGFVDGQADYKQNYRESGPYMGASYSFQYQDIGILAFSFAYADMNGEYEDNANDPNNDFADAITGAPTFVAFKYKGDSTGTSIGVTWTGFMGDWSAYFFDFRRQQYSMKGEDVTGLPNFDGVSLRTDEEMIGLTAGVHIYF